MRLLIRTASLVFIAAIVALVTRLIIARGADTALIPGPEPSLTQMDPQERCVGAVMGLLSRSVEAVREGYTGGLNLDEVAGNYGTDSDVFNAFSHTQAVVIGDVISHGADGQLAAIQPEVRRQCGQGS